MQDQLLGDVWGNHMLAYSEEDRAAFYAYLQSLPGGEQRGLEVNLTTEKERADFVSMTMKSIYRSGALAAFCCYLEVVSSSAC